jgi:DNA (cytosine-5)-methyltransferase 1
MREACHALGLNFNLELALDSDPAAMACFKRNFSPRFASQDYIERVFSSSIGELPTDTEKSLLSEMPTVDILLGGPPCQGHSDLNNSTRRNDPKNSLYWYMARATEILRPKHVLIENVTGALHDKEKVVHRVVAHLTELGYSVSLGIIDLLKIGVPQTRKRLVLLASREKRVEPRQLETGYATDERNLRWAVGDLTEIEQIGIFDAISEPSPDNRKRIDFLFENGLDNLPNEERPACHREKKHTYNSVYGKLRWDRPAQTITRGFYSMCMGRFVHPSARRTLTAHEAARIQFFPDFYDWSTVSSRTVLARLIGNAVPSKLSYVAGLEFLR